MSNLYYAYAGENASSTAPQPSSLISPDPIASFPNLQLRPPAHTLDPRIASTHPPSQRSIVHHSQQAWSAESQRALEPTHTSISNLLSLATSNTPQNLTSNPNMNSTRAAAVPPRPVPSYEDNLFHVMGKGFNETNRQQHSSSPPSRTTQLSAQFVRPAAASAVFDPSEFPSLGAIGTHPVMTPPTTSSLLDNAPRIEHSLTTSQIPSSALNGIPPYQDLYSLGAYGESRVKAVDALNGPSAASEFNMQSEDFPALGGAPASGALRPPNPPTSLANGFPFQIVNPSTHPTLSKAPLFDSLFDRKIHPASLQGQSLLERGSIRQDPTRAPISPRSSRLPNGYPVDDPVSSMPAHNVPNAHITSQHPFPDLPGSSPRRNAISSNGKPLFQMRSRQLDLSRRGDELETASSRDIRERQNLSNHIPKPIPHPEELSARPRMSNVRPTNIPISDDTTTRGVGKIGNELIISSSSVFPAEKYGMLSLLPLVSSAGENIARQDRVLQIGVDLTALGLNLNSPEPLYKTFHNPWEGGQGRTPELDAVGVSQRSHEPEFRLPTCYYMQPPALRSSHFSKFQLETLFYIFYIMPHDVLELLAAVELYNRKWRYHKTLKLWFTCDIEESGGFDGGYIYFDIKSWGKRQFHEANQSFINGFMTAEELEAVQIPPL